MGFTTNNRVLFRLNPFMQIYSGFPVLFIVFEN